MALRVAQRAAPYLLPAGRAALVCGLSPAYEYGRAPGVVRRVSCAILLSCFFWPPHG